MENSFQPREGSLRKVWTSFGNTPLEMEEEALEHETSINSNGCTQALHLELDENLDDSDVLLDTQETTGGTQIDACFPRVGASPSEEVVGKPEKRLAESDISDSASPKKKHRVNDAIDLNDSIKIEASNMDDEQDLFSDVEVISANNSKSVEVVTIGDSTGDSVDTFSQSNLGASSLVEDKETGLTAEDEPEKLEVSQGEAVEDKEKSDESSKNIGEAYLNQIGSKDSPHVDLKNAAQTSTPDRADSGMSSRAPPPNFHTDDTLKISSQSSPEDFFKSPDENVGHVIVALKPSEFRKLSGTIQVDHHFFISQDVPDIGDKFLKMRSFLTNKKVDVFKRLSEISSLSGTSSGYRGDVSSLVTSSDGSKRDRLSIMPEATIAPHKVLSPLPKRLWPLPIADKGSDEKNAEGDSDPDSFKVGTKVFAKWVERLDVKFWPGVIAEKKDEKILIHFDDGLKKELKTEDVILADSLIPGQQVNVEKETGVCHAGIILSYPDCSEDQKDIFYTVELESLPNLPQGEAESISYRMFHMTLDQKNKLKNECVMASHSADVSLDNLVLGKRKSKPVTPVKTTPKRGKKGGSAIETSVNEEEESEAKQLKKTRRTRSKLAKLIEEKAIIGSSTEDEERTRSKPRKGSSRPTSDLFKDMVFVLTQGKGKPNDDDLNHGASAMETETESEVDDRENFDALKFDKLALSKLIKDNGGKVLEKFSGEKEKVPANLIVISDRFCRTMTYLLGVAYGCERVNFVWIHNCVTAKKLLPKQNYLLQVGFSTMKNREVEHHEIESNLRDLFKEHHILIASSERSFGEDWKPLLTRLGATVSVRTKGKLDRTLKKVDVIIGDSNPPASIVKDSRDKSMFIVTTEWIVQCLIDGQRLPYGDFVL